MFREDINKFYRNLGMETTEARETPSLAVVLLEVIVGEKKHRIMRQQNG